MSDVALRKLLLDRYTNRIVVPVLKHRDYRTVHHPLVRQHPITGTPSVLPEKRGG